MVCMGEVCAWWYRARLECVYWVATLVLGVRDMKKLKRKARYEVLSVRLIARSLEGMYLWDSLDMTMKFRNTREKWDYISPLVSKDIKMDGRRAYVVKARVGVRNASRKVNAYINNVAEKSIGVLAVDEMQAYRIASLMIEQHWKEAYKLNRYGRAR